jgi:hypothetical protein
VGGPQAGQGEPVPVGLLPAEPAIARETRGERDGARIDLDYRQRGADQAALVAGGGLGEQGLE